MPISVYSNIPIPSFLKHFAMEGGTIGYSGKLLCLPVRKGTVGHILNITLFRNGGRRMSYAVQCLLCALMGRICFLHIYYDGRRTGE